MNEPRNLKVLRIDDDLDAGGNPAAPRYAAQRAPRHLDSIELDQAGQRVPGIRSWKDAILFWEQYNQAQSIDLIIADVRFDDHTTPLVNLAVDGNRLPLPTGISHFKAFAALARAHGRPIGVGMHTKEAQVWRNYAKAKGRDLQYVAMLAAHEIGELAGILGETGDFVRRDAEDCWAWLEKRTITSDDFRKAIPPALTQFRSKLRNFRLMPKDYEALVAWCARMEASCAQDGCATLRLTNQEDQGFPITGTDGTRDVISFRSLFADCLLERTKFLFEKEGLPRASYELKEDPDFYKLDEGFPRIGALIYQCGQFGRAYSNAKNILAQFPPVPSQIPSLKLSKVRSDLHAGTLDTALAILLQDVARDHAVQSAWRNLYCHYEWHPLQDAFRQSATDETSTLQFWVNRVGAALSRQHSISHETIMQLFEDGGYDRTNTDWPEGFIKNTLAVTNDDIFVHAESLPDQVDDQASNVTKQRQGWPGTRRCIEALSSLGVVRRDRNKRAYVPIQKLSTNRIPPCPSEPPHGFFLLSELGEAYGDGEALYAPQATLRALFGYPRTDYNDIIQRTVGDAFGFDGMGFLNAFRKGRPPVSWVKALCRDYARDELGWTDEGTWPVSLL